MLCEGGPSERTHREFHWIASVSKPNTRPPLAPLCNMADCCLIVYYYILLINDCGSAVELSAGKLELRLDTALEDIGLEIIYCSHALSISVRFYSKENFIEI